MIEGNDKNRSRSARGMTPTIDRVKRPFFEAPPGDPRAERMLLISYCFPPEPSVGSVRWHKLVTLAAERGWVFDVITRAPTGSALEDLGRLDSLPPGTRVFGVEFREHAVRPLERALLAFIRSIRARAKGLAGAFRRRDPATAAGSAPSAPVADRSRSRPHSIARSDVPRYARSIRDLLRAYFVWTDHSPYARWARRARDLALDLASQRCYSAVCTSGPPHMVHEAGRALSDRLRIPFVMDLRDPWSLAEHVPESLASPLWIRLASGFEARAVRQAAVVAANTDVLANALRSAYPGAASRVLTVRNGSDDDDPLPAAARGERFVIAYPGIFYGFDFIRVVFEATARAAKACGATPADIGIEIIGPFSEADRERIRSIASEVGAGAFVNVGPARPRRQALEFMAAGTMLVALPGHNVMTVIPSKLYEYARLEAWVLALAEPSSALEQVLRGTRADVVSVSDVSGAARVIEQRYREHRAGVRPTPIGADGRFSRRIQAAALFDAIEVAIASRTAARAGDAGLGAADRVPRKLAATEALG